jgi:hypothetical protein
MSNSDPTLFERLAKVEPAKLVRLLVELAAQDQTILEQVQFLLASGDMTAIAKAVPKYRQDRAVHAPRT